MAPPDQYRAAPLRGLTENTAQLESPDLMGLGKHSKSAASISIQMVLTLGTRFGEPVCSKDEGA